MIRDLFAYTITIDVPRYVYVDESSAGPAHWGPSPRPDRALTITRKVVEELECKLTFAALLPGAREGPVADGFFSYVLPHIGRDLALRVLLAGRGGLEAGALCSELFYTPRSTRPITRSLSAPPVRREPVARLELATMPHAGRENPLVSLRIVPLPEAPRVIFGAVVSGKDLVVAFEAMMDRGTTPLLSLARILELPEGP